MNGQFFAVNDYKKLYPIAFCFELILYHLKVLHGILYRLNLLFRASRLVAVLIVYVGMILLTMITVITIGFLYAKNFSDTLSAIVALVSLAIIIWSADSLSISHQFSHYIYYLSAK